MPGLVLEWRKVHPRRWEAYVVWFDDAVIEAAVRIAWLKPAQLIPVGAAAWICDI